MRNWFVWLWFLLFFAYHLAWTVHPTAAFTLNGFDLAEQVGLHPAIMAENPPLRTAGLLRLAIPLIATGLAFAGSASEDARFRWIWRGVAALIALRLIPPQAALNRAILENDHAFQMFILMLAGYAGIFLTLFIQPHRYIHLGLSATALILPLIGYRRSFQLLEQLGLEISIGGGLIIYVGILIILMGMSIKNRPCVKHV